MLYNLHTILNHNSVNHLFCILCMDIIIRNIQDTRLLGRFVPIFYFNCEQWPNLKNLSGGLNLSRGLNMVGST